MPHDSRLPRPMKPKLVVILGPTGVGKSEIAVDVALAAGGEVVNADSQLVYRGMNIGTAKPSEATRQGVPHHLIDIVDPDEDFNAARYRELALEAIEGIRTRGKNPIVCGGSGLYLRALLHGIFVGPAKDASIRGRLEEESQVSGLNVLHERLQRLDPAAAAKIHPNDGHRIVRALEVFEVTGKPISDWQTEHGFKESAFYVLKIGLNRQRSALYHLIDRRTEEMIAAGLLEEVEGLAASGYALDLPALQSIGYRQIGLHLRGELTLDEAVALIKRDSHHLAKRQLTWFRADKEIRWFDAEKDREQIKSAIKEFVA
jgi:tRNA dimethylallyltransferase